MILSGSVTQIMTGVFGTFVRSKRVIQSQDRQYEIVVDVGSTEI
jgi:hypothetical protein